MSENQKNAPGGHQAREIPTARSLLQAQHERDMADGEARLKALLRRHA